MRIPLHSETSGTQLAISTDEVLLRSDIATVGTFFVARDDARFAEAGPITEGPVLVFPRHSCVIEQEGRPPFVADPTVVVRYNRGTAYQRRPLSAHGDRCDWFSFREGILRDALGTLDAAIAERGTAILPLGPAPSDPRSYLLQRSIVRQLRDRTPVDPLAIEEQLLALLQRLAGVLVRSTPAPKPASQRAAIELARRVCHVLGETYLESLSVHAIAQRVDTSPFHLCRQFRAATGHTLHGYRNQLRMRDALGLLSDGRPDLTRIALDLGFSSHSHFSAAFRAAFGVTPSTYRKHPSRSQAQHLPVVIT